MTIVMETVDLGDLLPPAEINDSFVGGKDLRLLETLSATIEKQKLAGSILGVTVRRISVDEYDGSVESLNRIIEAINRNFIDIEEALRGIGDRVDRVRFDEAKKVTAYFSESKKMALVSIDNDGISIEGSTRRYRYNAADETMTEER